MPKGPEFISHIFDAYKSGDFYQRSALVLAGYGLINGMLVSNKFASDPISSFIIDSQSEVGVLASAFNLRFSPRKNLALLTGALGVVSSVLTKTSNPELIGAGIGLATAVAAVAAVDMWLIPNKTKKS